MKNTAVISLLCLGCLGIGYYIGKSHDQEVHEPRSAIRPEPARPQSPVLAGTAGTQATQPASVETTFGLPAGGSIRQRLDAAKQQIREPFASAAMAALIAGMQAGETQEVFEWLQQPGNKPSDFPRIWELFWMQHGVVDIEGALAKSASAKKAETGGSWQVKHLFEGLAKEDPSRAAQALTKLTDPKDIAWAVEGVAVRWAESDAAAATRWGLEQEDPEFRQKVLRAIPFSLLLKEGVPGLANWWSGLPPEERTVGFENAVRPVLESRSSTPLPPEGLWQLIAAGDANGLSNTALNRLWASAAGKSDAAGSWERLAAHPAGPELAGPFFGQWALSDAGKAVAALEALPETSALRQPGLEAAAISLAQVDAEKSLALAGQVTDDAVRQNLQAKIDQIRSQKQSEP